ncbi:SpoIID/LytB domain-containing protein [Neobacillus muris]|uniref:SpoIID/LytB domain-containing protein n=1 Tax=Neobacillus muris TaxID=2941334 RepID=UPI00203D03A5|nr:SpoIID/LytB domain-containing protein [Neobacillus muris]
MVTKRVSPFISVVSIVFIVAALFLSFFSSHSTVYASESQTIFTEKIMSKDTADLTLELELQGHLKLAADYQIAQKVDGKLYKKSLKDVRVGAENVSVTVNDQHEITNILIDGLTPVKTMRVGIMTTNFAAMEHNEIKLSSPTGLKIVDKAADKTYEAAADELLTFRSADGTITGVKADGTDLFSTKNRVYVSTDDASKIKVANISRAQGVPEYRGSFEITSVMGNKLHLINDIDLEEYLYQVVPSEMPASFGLSALKAQAVAARTYALGDYLGDRFAKDGYFVLDSVMSQVYNNSAENALTAQAVQETKGTIMYGKDGTLVDARYYSTSGGFGASKHQVWSDADGSFPGQVVPYLLAQSYTFDPADPTKMLAIDTQNEQEILNFYKNLSYTGYDDTSAYFRWKVSFSKQELANTINANIGGRYTADPNFVLTKSETGEFVSKPIPAEGIGEFKNMYVTKRGDGGNIMELVIEGSTGTYKIVKEYNIRFTIRPMSTYTGGANVLLYRATGGSSDYTAAPLTNYSILPSAFFSFEINDQTGVTFYGGGNGHGVGMSQYGASQLGAAGWSFDKILTSYYPNMNLTNVSVVGAPGPNDEVISEPDDGDNPANPGNGDNNNPPGDDNNPANPGNNTGNPSNNGNGSVNNPAPGSNGTGNVSNNGGNPSSGIHNLPVTATNSYNVMALGLSVLLLGTVLFFINRRRQQQA